MSTITPSLILTNLFCLFFGVSSSASVARSLPAVIFFELCRRNLSIINSENIQYNAVDFIIIKGGHVNFTLFFIDSTWNAPNVTLVIVEV